MKLSEWAKQQGITYKTAWKWYKAGKLPVRAEQMPTGTIIVYPENPVEHGKVTIYARVSSADQKEDLARQISRLKDYAAAKGWTIASVAEEVGSGLNGRRKKLLELLKDPSVGEILVEHRDRLARFGFEYIDAALMSQGRSIMVADETEEMDDIWQDFIDVVTSTCARIYGRRGARNRAKKAVEAVKDNEG
ncbi:MAG: IS607 family transposase [Actinobacteria bacterium]|nr:IS607 family transposase [Actinomycetota bacterium]